MNESSINESGIVLAVAADLVRCLVQEVAGDEISDMVSGSQLTTSVLVETALSGFQNILNETK